MPRAGLSRSVVIERAAQMLDDPDLGSLSLALVAESFGVKAPSLYKHVQGLADLHRGVAVRAKEDLAAVLAGAAVGRASADAVRAMADAYRSWALAHPGQYPLTTRAPVPGDADDETASERLVELVSVILRGFDLGSDQLVDATRFLRSALHGFVSLETGGAFELPISTDDSFVRLVDGVILALEAWSSR
ncbi:TetR/AcrR family transcriptional regulator [Microbacterium sp. TNHR37B]|uniref:TetR/AcrR family transcriptional regulator n=1 Tax=Microbacterium sp. TNHR37B TaxID=1775956 RepID=UPI0007B31ACA|nr:TetR-like C-terminal domain-containing protein [Microbacterium sp. TNHR37B]KZE89642.1 hypothetical protein AVP41_02440 [Microbacterium sp. TNHR37B]